MLGSVNVMLNTSCSGCVKPSTVVVCFSPTQLWDVHRIGLCSHLSFGHTSEAWLDVGQYVVQHFCLNTRSSSNAGGVCPKIIRQLMSSKLGSIVKGMPSSFVKKYCVGILHEFTQRPVHPLVSRYRHFWIWTPLFIGLSFTDTSTTCVASPSITDQPNSVKWNLETRFISPVYLEKKQWKGDRCGL